MTLVYIKSVVQLIESKKQGKLNTIFIDLFMELIQQETARDDLSHLIENLLSHTFYSQYSTYKWDKFLVPLNIVHFV